MRVPPQVLGGIIPPISYLTRLDAYALMSLVFLLLATSMHAAIGFVINDCNADGDCTFRPVGLTTSATSTLDGTFMWSYVGLWLLANLLYIIAVYRRRWRQRHAFSTAVAKNAGFVPASVVQSSLEWYAAVLDQPDFMPMSSFDRNTTIAAGVGQHGVQLTVSDHV